MTWCLVGHVKSITKVQSFFVCKHATLVLYCMNPINCDNNQIIIPRMCSFLILSLRVTSHILTQSFFFLLHCSQYLINIGHVT